MKGTIIGIDLAKSVFHLCAANKRGRVLWRKKTTRRGLEALLAELPPSRIAMEACGGSHYWARRCLTHGHVPRLISGKFVKPFIKSNKNDVIDAEAITEAAQRATMRFVPAKTTQQQDIQAVHRVRERWVRQRTAVVNQCRGLLLENGITVVKGRHHLQRELAVVVENHTGKLSGTLVRLLGELREELRMLNERIERLDDQLTQLSRELEPCARLLSIPGVGALTATALFAAVGTGADFKNGRHLAAWLGLVPRQFTTGGKPKLLGISKRGDAYLRKLLIHGARSVLSSPRALGAPQRWARTVATRCGANKAAVALANKNSRIAWKLLRSGEVFRAGGSQRRGSERHRDRRVPPPRRGAWLPAGPRRPLPSAAPAPR
jgi:transposase